MTDQPDSYQARKDEFAKIVNAEKPSAILHIGDSGTPLMSTAHEVFRDSARSDPSLKQVFINFYEGISNDSGKSLKREIDDGLSHFSEHPTSRPLFMINMPELRIGREEDEALSAGLRSMSELVAQRGGSLVVNSYREDALQWVQKQISEKLPTVNVGTKQARDNALAQSQIVSRDFIAKLTGQAGKPSGNPPKP